MRLYYLTKDGEQKAIDLTEVEICMLSRNGNGG